MSTQTRVRIHTASTTDEFRAPAEKIAAIRQAMRDDDPGVIDVTLLSPMGTRTIAIQHIVAIDVLGEVSP